MKIKFGFLIIMLILSIDSCISDQKYCKNHMLAMIRGLNQKDLIELIGYSATFKGKDDNGNRFLREIVFTDSLKSRFSMPTFQERNKLNISEKQFNCFKVATYNNVDSTNAISYAENIAKKLVINMTKNEVYEVNSQKHLGNFIEFNFFSGCSLYFKLKDDYISSNYKNYFETKSFEIAPNWFILRNDDFTDSIYINYFNKKK